MSWTTVELGECVTELRGGASVKRDEFTDSGFPVLHKGTIREGAHLVFDRDGKTHVPTAFAAAKPNAVVDSDFIVATFRNLVRTGETLGFMAPVPDEGQFLLAQGAYGLKLNDSRLDKRFLAHLSNAWVFHKEVLKRMVGTTQVHIRNSEFLKIPIPLPPLAEQKQIAGILDAADALRAKRSESLAQLDTLLQSTFLDMFGDPVTNPMEWPIESLEDLCFGITDIDHKMPKAVDSGIPFISAKDLVNDGSISFKDVKQISEDDFNRLARKGKPEKGDIVYSRIGAKLGKARLVEVDFDFLASYSCCTIKPNEGSIDKHFLCYLLDSPSILRQAQSNIRAIAVPDLGLGKIKAFKIITPPRDLQSRFTAIVKSVERQKASQRAHLAELDTLFGSLQSRAFRGDL